MSSVVRAILDLNNYHRHFLTGEEFEIDITGLDHFLFCGDLCTGKNYDELKNAGIRNIYLLTFSRYNENSKSIPYFYQVTEQLNPKHYLVRKADMPLPVDLFNYLETFHTSYTRTSHMTEQQPAKQLIVDIYMNDAVTKPYPVNMRRKRVLELFKQRKIPLAGSMTRPENPQSLMESDVDFIIVGLNEDATRATLEWLNPNIQVNIDKLQLCISYMHSGEDLTGLNYGFLQSKNSSKIVMHEVPPSLYGENAFDYPVAMRALLDGRAISRIDWGNMTFISMNEAHQVRSEDLWSKYNRVANVNCVNTTVARTITKNVNGMVLPYVVTNEDIFAKDWVICDWVESRHQMEMRRAKEVDQARPDVDCKEETIN